MATRASVRIACGEGVCTVQVADDGSGPAGGEPALGAALLDRVTGGEWSLEPGAGGGAVAVARPGPTPAR